MEVLSNSVRICSLVEGKVSFPLDIFVLQITQFSYFVAVADAVWYDFRRFVLCANVEVNVRE